MPIGSLSRELSPGVVLDQGVFFIPTSPDCWESIPYAITDPTRIHSHPRSSSQRLSPRHGTFGQVFLQTQAPHHWESIVYAQVPVDVPLRPNTLILDFFERYAVLQTPQSPTHPYTLRFFDSLRTATNEATLPSR